MGSQVLWHFRTDEDLMSTIETSLVNSKVPPVRKKRTRNYINNADFYVAMKEFIAKRRADPNHQVPPYIGQCLLQLATRYSMKPNFYGYSYREEMIGDALENCIKYIDRFDPEKSNNPFAYFTQFVKNAFIIRIQEEQGLRYNMIKNMRQHLVTSGSGGAGDYCLDEQVRIENDVYENNAMFLQAYEQSMARRRAKAAERQAAKALEKQPLGIERFEENDE